MELLSNPPRTRANVTWEAWPAPASVIRALVCWVIKLKPSLLNEANQKELLVACSGLPT